MEKYKKGGYTILDLESSTIYADSVKALDSNKPVVVYDGTNKPYYADSVTTSGTNVVITKGGKTITIANDNTITNVGDIQPLMENIVDKNGNPRFIEGDIDGVELTGLTNKYLKWSLSGSHLMIVVAFDVANGTTLGSTLYTCDLPDFILDKIYPVVANTIARQSFPLFNSSLVSQNVTVELGKSATGLGIWFSSTTITDDRSGRLQFDLLIDAE